MMKKRTLAALLSLALCCTSAAALAKTETKYGLTIESENGDWRFAEESVTATGNSGGAGIGGGFSGPAYGVTISGGSITASSSGGNNGVAIVEAGSGVGGGTGASASSIVITPEKHRIEASVSNTGFSSMTELEGSPFTEGSTDVTEQVTGFQYFKTIGERIGAIDMPSTGDSASLALWTCLLSLSGALLALMKRRTAG